jgi:aspartate aminotransferase
MPEGRFADALPSLSPRAERIQASPAATLRRRMGELQAAGRDVIVLSSGDLDFPTPPHVVAAAHAAALRGDTRYTNADGTPELKDAIRAKLKRENGLEYDRDEVIACNGSIQAMFNAFMATLEPGDEVIVPAPYWPSYLGQVALAGGIPVTVPCPQNNAFKLRPEALETSITERTRWIVINNPTNPSGALYSRAELAAIAQVLLRHPRVGVVADDLYEHMIFDDREFATIAAVEPRLRDRVLVVNAVSKAYAMMGWRLGYAAGPRAIVGAMARIQSHTSSCPSSISQAAALAALSGPQDLLRERALALAGRRDMMVELLNRAAGLSCVPPPGTFYLLTSCAGVLGTITPDGKPIECARDFAGYLLESENVAVLPGEDCGVSPYVRISFALTPERLREAGARIVRACAALHRSHQ